MREAKFSLEVLGEKCFDAFTQGETWNGWACPYFTFDQAQQLVKAFQERGVKAWYDEHSDAFTFEVEGGETVKEVDTFQAEEVNGKKFYPIGAFCWIWDMNVTTNQQMNF